jgi:hypothetical protein
LERPGRSGWRVNGDFDIGVITGARNGFSGAEFNRERKIEDGE